VKQKWQRRWTYQQFSSILRVQCKLNLQTDRFNLHRVLTDEFTTNQFGVLRNRWKWTYKQISSNLKWIIDADVDTDELTTYQFIETDDRDRDELTTYQFIETDDRGIDELTTYQFINTGKKGYRWTYYRSVHRYRYSVNWIY
jgi:hypothetical protein